MNGSKSSAAAPSGVQGICPGGWHVPSSAEWDTLVNFAGGNKTAGCYLKADNYAWNSYAGISNLDAYGFSALPGGYYNSAFSLAYLEGFWWTATKYTSTFAYLRNIFYNACGVGTFTNPNASGFSLRCVQDPG